MYILSDAYYWNNWNYSLEHIKCIMLYNSQEVLQNNRCCTVIMFVNEGSRIIQQISKTATDSYPCCL